MYTKKKMLTLFLVFVLVCSSVLIISNFYLNDNVSSDPDDSEPIDSDKDDSNKEAEDSKIIKMINQVKRDSVYKYLSELVDIGVKPTRSENCDRAAVYIYNKFKEMGLDVEYQEWKYPLLKGKNVIATLPGKDVESDAVFIVCAHYDTWKNTVGANDDASGIAAMLMVAEIMSKYSFNHTFRFIALSGHESPPFYTYGSTAYVRKAYRADENIVGVLNLDMIGNTSKEGNVFQLHGTIRSEWLINFVNKINEKYYDLFDVKIENFRSKPGADESSFITYGYDAVLIIQSNFWEPPNHEPGDDISTINFDSLTNVTKMILACAVNLADKRIDLQVRITKPKEDYVYFFDRPVFRAPGLLNFKRFGLRSMTYIVGGITVKLDIRTDDEIKNVYFFLDDKITYKNVVSEPPFEFKIEKRKSLKDVIRGKHKIGVKVFTYSGLTAVDEIEVLFIP